MKRFNLVVKNKILKLSKTVVVRHYTAQHYILKTKYVSTSWAALHTWQPYRPHPLSVTTQWVGLHMDMEQTNNSLTRWCADMNSYRTGQYYMDQAYETR